MAKYIVDYYQKCSKSYEVEACSKAQAKEILLEKIENGLEYEPRCFNCEEEVFEIEEINEAYLIDGVASCCGYDFVKKNKIGISR